jgi:nucleoside-diphosphate-sugar epimerase
MKVTPSMLRRVVVFGGSGYVGSAIARALTLATTSPAVKATTQTTSSDAAKADAKADASDAVDIVCASRTGAPPSWARDEPRARWVKCDALDVAQCRETVRGATAVVTAIGGLPFPWLKAEEIVRTNGATNVIPGRAAMEEGVRRLVVVGASIPPFVPGLASYAEGKAQVEAFARDEFASESNGRRAFILKPAAVSGTRRMGGGVTLPLSLVMDPTRAILRACGGALVENAPVPLENVARAAVKAALDDAYGNDGFTMITNKSLIEDFGGEVA